jgi:hypothetical protein
MEEFMNLFKNLALITIMHKNFLRTAAGILIACLLYDTNQLLYAMKDVKDEMARTLYWGIYSKTTVKEKEFDVFDWDNQEKKMVLNSKGITELNRQHYLTKEEILELLSTHSSKIYPNHDLRACTVKPVQRPNVDQWEWYGKDELPKCLECQSVILGYQVKPSIGQNNNIVQIHNNNDSWDKLKERVWSDSNKKKYKLKIGRYETALAQELVDNHCKKLVCGKLTKRWTTQKTFSVPVNTKVGEFSNGMGGRSDIYKTTYENQTVVRNHASSECPNCHTPYDGPEPSDPNGMGPTVKFIQNFDEKNYPNQLQHILQIWTNWGGRRLCQQPKLEGELLEIWRKTNKSSNGNWNKTLESMWNIARQLDFELYGEQSKDIRIKVWTNDCIIL